MLLQRNVCLGNFVQDWALLKRLFLRILVYSNFWDDKQRDKVTHLPKTGTLQQHRVLYLVHMCFMLLSIRHRGDDQDLLSKNKCYTLIFSHGFFCTNVLLASSGYVIKPGLLLHSRTEGMSYEIYCHISLDLLDSCGLSYTIHLATG